jgi:transcriptional regulator with XRE-family HTH domain
MDFAEQLGFRIASLRRQKGLTQSKLCQASGLRQPHLSQIEKGKFWMRLETLEAICKGLGLHPDELMRGIRIKIN